MSCAAVGAVPVAYKEAFRKGARFGPGFGLQLGSGFRVLGWVRAGAGVRASSSVARGPKGEGWSL